MDIFCYKNFLVIAKLIVAQCDCGKVTDSIEFPGETKQFEPPKLNGTTTICAKNCSYSIRLFGQALNDPDWGGLTVEKIKNFLNFCLL